MLLALRQEALERLNVGNSVVKGFGEEAKHTNTVKVVTRPPYLIHKLAIDLLKLFDGAARCTFREDS